MKHLERAVLIGVVVGLLLSGRGEAAQGVISSLKLVDQPITNVFNMVSDLTGWSIIMSPEVSRKPPRVNIWVKNMTPEQILEHVATMSELVLERKGNTVRVMTFGEYTRIYGVQKHVVELKHAGAKDVVAMLKPFVTKDDASRVLADDSGNRIVLLVPRVLTDSLARLIRAVDVPLEEEVIRIVVLKHQEAGILAPAVETFVGGRTGGKASASKKGGTGGSGGGWFVQMMPEPRLNVIVMKGLAKDLEKALSLIADLDVPTNVEVRSYELRYTDARDVFENLKEIIRQGRQADRGRSGGGMPPRLRVSLSEQNNRIVIEGSPADHDRVGKVIAAIDKPLPPSAAGMRVYRLENSSAEEVAKVLTDLIDDENRRPRARTDEQHGTVGRTSEKGKSPSSGGGKAAPAAKRASSEGKHEQAPGGDIPPPRVSTAPEINAVIVRASAVEHEELASVIRELDKPRDQVMLEVTLVVVRSDDSLNLGVELGGARLGSSGVSTVGFTTFGIGTVDSATGAIRLASPAPVGLNYSVFSSDDFSLALNILRTVGDVRITSAPRILVEDNAVAEISQFSEEPYQTTSQGEETTVSGFGGFVQAGTAMTVVPYIAKEGWLRLKYSISLSSFGTRTAQQELANLPPPRRETKTGGTVRIPADHMVVLGGLVATRDDESVDAVPFLSDIPLLGELFKNRSRNKTEETLFIFIRPVVLRDPEFRDLLSISEQDIRKAQIANAEYPSNPMKMLIPSGGADKEGGE